MHFIITILGHFVAMIIARILFMVVAAFIFLLIVTRLFAQVPGDFLYVTDLELDNTGASTSTRMLPVPVNALNYVNSTLIRPDGTDRVFTDSNNVTVPGFTQDMNINAANWWVMATAPPTTITTQKVFHGGTDADLGFPLLGLNAGTGQTNHPPLRATSTATLQIGNDLDIRIDIQSDVPCGLIAAKTSSNYYTKDGWDIWAIGQKELAPSNNGTGGSNDEDSIYFELTPKNFPVWICSIGNTVSTLALNRGNPDINISFVDVDSGVRIYDESFVDVVYNAAGGEGSANGIILLPEPAFVAQNQHVRIFVRTQFANIWEFHTNGACNLDSGDFIFEISCGCTSGPGCEVTNSGIAASPWRRLAVQRIQITYIQANSATSTGAIGATIDDAQAISGATQWNGDRSTIQLTYLDPTVNVLLDTVVIASVAHVGGIATSTSDNDIRIGSGIRQGIIHNLEIDAGVTTVMDIDFDGDDISESRVGDVSNAFQWLGDIQDESGSNNDLQYILTANMTNINASVSGFGDNPTPTPTAGEIGTSTALLGLPSINPFFTPVPTPDGGLIMGNLKTGATASTLPVEAWWMLLSIIILAVALGIVHKFFPNKPIIAGLAVFGIAIVSLAVGEDFRMWIVAIFAVWAFGSTGLYILWAR